MQRTIAVELPCILQDCVCGTVIANEIKSELFSFTSSLQPRLWSLEEADGVCFCYQRQKEIVSPEDLARMQSGM